MMHEQEYITLHKMFRRFVTHSMVIHKRSKDCYYKSPNKIASLNKCLPYIDAFRVFSCGYANAVIFLQNDLRRILPKKSNSSYQSSLSMLNEMIALSFKIKDFSLQMCQESFNEKAQ